MTEVKIKNITVVVDGQEYSFSSRSVVADIAYDPAKDPQVQGTGVADLQPVVEIPAVVEPVVVAPVTEAEPVVETPADTSAIA